jgi:hypothetical protein
MKTSCRTRAARLLLAALCWSACASDRGPTPAEVEPVSNERAPREKLPDDAERSAAHVATAVLLDDDAEAASHEAEIARRDRESDARGEPPSGLADNAAELRASLGGSDAFPLRANQLLARRDLDPALQRRLEAAVASEPLTLARTRLEEERRFELGSFFNRVIEPLSTWAISGALNPIAASQTALSTLLAAHQVPVSSTRERQALRALDDWLERNPESPRRPEIAAQAAALRANLAEERYRKELRGAEEAFDARELPRARLLAERALRQRPGDSQAIRIESQAGAGIASASEAASQTLRVRAPAPSELGVSERPAFAALARQVIAAPLSEAAASASSLRERGAPPQLVPTLQLVESFAPRANGDEDGFATALGRVKPTNAGGYTAARQARAFLGDPYRNAYAAYERAESADFRARAAWLFLGRFSQGASHRDLPRPIEYLVELPALAMSVVTTPLRVVQYPEARTHFGGGVLVAGERYSAVSPQGAHAEEVHRELESLYAARGDASSALRHARARTQPDAARIAKYRSRVAEQLLAGAEREHRIDMEAAYYLAVLREYGDTPQAKIARERYAALKESASPQRIRLTKEFLHDHPPLWAPGALGLRAELMDGKSGNGELADEGVTLLGKNLIQLALKDREAVVSRVPAEGFALFVARLEEIRRDELASDAREKAVADPARDAFFSTARLGLIDSADSRPAARSEEVFQSAHEKHGFLHPRESLLPVDLVVRGDLDTLGLSAFPRIRLPEASPDAILYQ